MSSSCATTQRKFTIILVRSIMTLLASLQEISTKDRPPPDVTFVVVEVVSLQVSRSSIAGLGRRSRRTSLGDQVERVTAICPPTSSWSLQRGRDCLSCGRRDQKYASVTLQDDDRSILLGRRSVKGKLRLRSVAGIFTVKRLNDNQNNTSTANRPSFRDPDLPPVP